MRIAFARILDRSDPAYRAALDLFQLLPASAEHTSAIDHRVSDPESPNSGIGVERSLPRDLQTSRNAEVMTAQNALLPSVATSVAIKPVMGLIEHIYRVSRRARCVLGGNARCTRANRGRRGETMTQPWPVGSFWLGDLNGIGDLSCGSRGKPWPI